MKQALTGPGTETVRDSWTRLSEDDRNAKSGEFVWVASDLAVAWLLGMAGELQLVTLISEALRNNSLALLLAVADSGFDLGLIPPALCAQCNMDGATRGVIRPHRVDS